MTRVLVVIVPLLVGAVSLAGEERALSIRAVPRMAGSPATVVVTIIVEPRERNRTLSVTLDSGNYYRSSELSLDGDRAPRSHQIRYEALPAGEYVIVSSLRTQTGAIATARTSVLVTGEP